MSVAVPTIPVELLRLATNRITLHAAAAGPVQGPLVILLHGFPEFWYGWKKQIGPLADAGYRVLVPDQRGYNLSDKPAGIANYAIDKLADDVVGLIKAVGHEQCDLIGHDWGAAVAWWAAMRSVPEPACITSNRPTRAR